MNAPLRPLAEGLPRRRFSVADFVRMAEVGLIGQDERLELLDGEIVPMAAKGSRHEAIKGAITRLWGRTCPEGFTFMQETGLYLSERTYLEPDFIVYRETLALADVTGRDVLLAVEVADSSLGYDLGRKPGIYASFGVHELWVIDAVRRVTHVHRDREDDSYASVETVAADARLDPQFAPADFGLTLGALKLA